MNASIPPILVGTGFFLGLGVPLAKAAATFEGGSNFRRRQQPSRSWAWNELPYSLTLIARDDFRPTGSGLPLAFFREMQQDWAGAMAASILAARPVVVVFGVPQRHFVQGLAAGAVKS